MAPIAVDTGLLSRSSSNNLTTPTCCLQHCKTLDQPVTDLYRQNCPNHVFNRDLFPIQALLHSGFQKQRGIGYKMFLGYPKQPVWLKCNSCKGVLSEALDSVRSSFSTVYILNIQWAIRNQVTHTMEYYLSETKNEIPFLSKCTNH